MTSVRTASIVATLLAAGSLACTSSEKQQPAQAPQTTAATVDNTAATTNTTPATNSGSTGLTGSQSPTAGMTTSGIMAVAHELTTAEVAQGKLAVDKASDPQVKAFAKDVVKDESARLDRQKQLMNGLGISPQGNDLSEQVKSNEATRMNNLQGMSGRDFDRSFMNGQVDYFRLALDTYDRQLIPNVMDPQIKASLVEARGRANQHLMQAQAIRGSLAAQ